MIYMYTNIGQLMVLDVEDFGMRLKKSGQNHIGHLVTNSI